MSRSFPFLVIAVFAVGVMGAEAHQVTPRIVAPMYASAVVQAEDLAAKVKSALKADPDLATPSEAVTVVSGAAGVVTLEGTVPTVQLRARIAELAMKVEGVTKLVNKLKLAKK